MNFKNHQQGFSALFLTILVLVTVLSIGVTILVLSLNQRQITRDYEAGSQSYYAAEAGLEDALLRLRQEMNFNNSYSLQVGNASTTVNISSINNGSRTITAKGEVQDRFRKTEVVYQMDSSEANFHYGAQVGEGGLTMGNGAEIQGNVYSNGNIVGSGNITGTVIVGGNGNKIEDISVGENAQTYSCYDSSITDTLEYVSGGTISNCSAGSMVDMGATEIDQIDLPLATSTIEGWKQDASDGTIISGDYTLDDTSETMGPTKIEGDLTVINNATLNLTGTLYVTGNINLDNNSLTKLDNDYDAYSGIIVCDGLISVRNNAAIQGSGQPSSYMMLLSTNSSLDPNNPAIDVYNNAAGAIFYTSNGVLRLHNNIEVKEATSYKLALDNNAVIKYEIGLENVDFSSGPSGGWEVQSWQEVE